MSEYLLDIRDEFKESRFGAYIIDDANNNITMMVNTTGRDSIPVFYNTWNINHLRRLTSNTAYTIDATYKPYPLSKNQQAQFDQIAGMWISIALGFVPPTIAAYCVRERMLNLKHLQFISGVSVMAYWLSQWIFDFINSLLTCILSIPVMYIFGVDGLIKDNVWATFVLIVCYSLSTSSYVYVLSFFFKSHSGAQNFILLIFFVTVCHVFICW